LLVLARTARELVAPLAAEQDVLAELAEEPVIAGATAELVPSGAAAEPVLAAYTASGAVVIAASRAYRVAP
jgi:hypothetical protein